MQPNVTKIFDSTAAASGAWFYVGKYNLWTLYVQNAADAATLVIQASNVPDTNKLGNLNSPAYQLAGPWKPSTSYALNALVLDYNNNVQKVTTPGISGSSVPTWANTGTTTDGTITWTFQAAQGSFNYNAAPISTATPAGVQIANLKTAAAPADGTAVGIVLVTGNDSLYIPGDDAYFAWIRIIKTGGGAADTVAYLNGFVE